MAILFRFLLFAILIYLVVRMIREFMAGPKDDDNLKKGSEGRKVRKDAGEYVDYEEVKRKGKRTKDNGQRKPGSG